MSRRQLVVLVAVGLVLVIVALAPWLGPADPDAAYQTLVSFEFSEGWIGEPVTPTLPQTSLSKRPVQVNVPSYFPKRPYVDWEFRKVWHNGGIAATAAVFGYSSRARAAASYWQWNRTWGNWADWEAQDASGSLCPARLQCRARCEPEADEYPPHCVVEWRSGSRTVSVGSDVDPERMSEDDLGRVVKDLEQALSESD